MQRQADLGKVGNNSGLGEERVDENKMKQKTADRLIERLGMTYEMSRLLHTPEDYQRFEQNMVGILAGLERTNPRIPKEVSVELKPGAWERWGHARRPFSNVPPKDKYIHFTYQCTGNFDEAIECFRRRYGIGTEEQAADQIAEETGIAERVISRVGKSTITNLMAGGETAEKAREWVRENFFKGVPGSTMVWIRTSFVTEVLKQQHKKEIWYGTI